MDKNRLLESMKLDIDKYLVEYLENDYAVYEFDLIANKGPKVKVRTISLKDQMEVESVLKELPENEVPLLRMHTYQLHYLSKVLLQVGDRQFLHSGEAFEYLTPKGTAFLDKILQVQTTFESLFRAELTSEDIENFTQTPSIDTEQSS